MEVRANPIVDRERWERLRAAAVEDPGAFHGDLAKREIHWLDLERGAWLAWDDEAGGWTGWDAATGEAVGPLDGLGPDHEPWERAFDDREAPVFRWFAGGLTNAAFNEVDRHVLAGHGRRRRRLSS